MPVLVTASTFPTPAVASQAALDIEWAPASVPGDAPSYTTMTGRVRGASVKRGRAHELDRFAAGKMTTTIANRDRLFDNSYSAGPWSGEVLPERQQRMVARYAGVTYPVFAGWLDGIPQTYPHHGKDSVVATQATDVFKVLAAADIPSSMYELAVTLDTPAHWWRLDESTSGTLTAFDHGYTFTFGGVSALSSGAAPSPIIGTYVGVSPGASGIVPYDGGRSCLALDHSSLNRVDITGQIVTAYPFTIEAWINCVSAPGSLRHIVWQGTQGYGGNVAFLVDSNDRANITVNDGYNSRVVTSVKVVADAKTHHVAVVATNATTYQIYIDGVAVSQTTTTTGSGSPSIQGPVSALGGITVTSGAFGLGGSLAEVATYNTALTVTQILTHYQAGKTAFNGDFTGTRMNRVLDYVGLPTALRSIATGDSALGSYDLPGGQAIDYLQQLAATESGQFYAARDGVLTFRNRHALLTDARSVTSQATFQDTAGGAFVYADIQIDPANEKNIRNDVTVTRQGGAPQRAVDSDSRRQYLLQSHSAGSRLYQTDNDALDDAQSILARYKDPQFRVDALTLNHGSDPANLIPQAFGREIGDRITVQITPMGLGTANSQEVIIEGIEHSFDPKRPATTTFKLSAADTGHYWVLGDTTYSVLGSTTKITA